MGSEVTREGGSEKGVGRDRCYRCKLTICTLEGGRGEGVARGVRGGKGGGDRVKQREEEERKRERRRWGRGSFYRFSGEGEAWLKESTPMETNKILF